ASLLERKIPDPVVLRLHAGNLPVGTGKFADRTYVITVNNRRSVADVGSFSADVHIVLIGQQIVARGVHAACDHWGATGEDKHDVFAEFSQVALVSRPKTFAHTDEQQQRSHTHGYAEHSEEGAQLVCTQGAEDLRENVQDHPHNQGYCSLEDPFRRRLSAVRPVDSLRENRLRIVKSMPA